MLLTAAPVDQFEQARILLSRVLPWAPVGDATAVMNLHWKFENPAWNGPPWSGRAFHSIDEAISQIKYAQKKADTRDIYFAVASMRNYEEVAYKSGNGRSMKKAIRNIDNVNQIRSLWVDIDVELGNKSGKAYPTTEEAIRAFAAFVKASGIPRPTLAVSSGSGGFHFYWCMNAALAPDHWQRLANAMAEATRRFGLLCDTGCTVDSARILRMPNTLNFKHTPPKPVELMVKSMLTFDYTVDEMQAALAPYLGATVIPLTPRGNNAPSQNSDLSGGITRPKAPPINLDSIATAGCGFVAGAIATGGALYANPLWNITTLLATFTDGGRADAHRMAMGHASYSQADTDALYDRKENERAVRDLGWPSCAAVENSGCKSCAGCPLKGPGTKPLQFGRVGSVAAPLGTAPAGSTPALGTSDLPHGYQRDQFGMIKKVAITKDGQSTLILIAPYPMYGAWSQDDPWTFHFTTQLGQTARETQISIAYRDVNSGDKFSSVMGGQGITLNKEQSALFREFIVSWSQKLKTIKDAIVSAAPFGWVEEHGGKVSGFAYGGRVWQPNNIDKPASTPDPVLALQYTPKGDLQPWVDAAAMVTGSKSAARDCYLAASFAGPLVRFTGQAGILISTYSAESGIGKSTALKVAQAVWGSPIKAIQSLSDTQNAVLNKTGTLQAIPMFWDELKTDQDTNRFVNITFQLSGGKEKSRMGSDAQLRDVGVWKTLLMSASNDSILDAVQRHAKTSAAGIYRVFEYQVPVIPQTMTASGADQIMLKLDQNYGQAGLAYAKFLGENHAQIHVDVATMKEALEQALMSKPDERFWIAAIAVLLLGAKYANQLGLTVINEQALYDFLVTCLGNMRNELRDSPVDMRDNRSVTNVLAQYVNHRKARNMLITDKLWTSAGKPPVNSIKILNPSDRLEGAVVQYAMDDKKMRISSTNFRLWMEEMGYSPHNILNAMKTQFGATTAHGTIGGGTTYSGFREYVIDLDCAHPTLAPLVEFN